MGVLSLYCKSKFLDLLKCLNSLNWFIVFFSLINLSVCIYEDQIGKFDWRQSYVGRIKFAQFDTVSTAKKLIVATEENVLAALNLKTGQIVWRHVFESTSTGNIQLLHVTDKVVTVSGCNPYLVRGWDSTTGILSWEWSLTLQNVENADFSEWWVQQGMLVHMLPVIGSHIEVTMYNLWSGSNKGSTSKLPAQWINDGCVLSAPYYTCVSGSTASQLLISLDVTSNAVQIISKPLSEFISTYSEVNLRGLDGNSVIPGFVLDDKKIVLIKNDQFEVVGVNIGDEAASVAVVDGSGGPMVLQTWSDPVKGFSLTAHSAASGQPLAGGAPRGLQLPEPELAAALCTKAKENVCRLLLTTADDAAHLMQQGGRILWSREEALANVVAAEFVDLPVSDLDAALESEFDQKEGSVWAAFIRRLQTQYQQLVTSIQSLQRGEAMSEDEPTQLVRDYFNLHKIIVLVTDVGKVFGMDNLSGEILWKQYEPNLDTEGLQIFSRRTARHPPHDACLTIVGKHEETGRAIIINLNPITGALLERPQYLPVRPLQCALLHRPDKQKLHALILLDTDENVQIFPETAAPLVENMFMYVIDKYTAKVQGYALKYNGQRVAALRTWSVAAGGAGGAGGARVSAAVAKHPDERAHSAGTVLADRSVLYKHNNPNLLLVVADSHDPLHKDVVIATCIDAVSGAVVHAQVHRRARAAPLAVHTEHSLAYVYYNDKQRRTEIASVELYEGAQRWMGAGAASSWAGGGGAAPLVYKQAYIAPPALVAAATTRTDKGITDKHVLLWLSSGALAELPWQLVSARRTAAGAGAGAGGPAGAGAAGAPDEGPEGGAPYVPELPLAAGALLNYNRTLQRPRALHTAPAGLESTCLVLATGLDLFYTRVAPSKTFDLLKDDFDYFLITVVLAALVVASYSTKYFASRKMLKMAWK